MTPEQRRIIKKIERYPELRRLIKTEKILPLPHRPSNRVRAIVVGADPSNPSEHTFTHVFGIGGRDKRYFQGVENNLEHVGLSQDDVYVQNLVQNYCTLVTDSNDKWYDFAKLWLPELKRELDAFERDIPVFVTARKILCVLTGKLDGKNAWYSNYYREPTFVPASENALGRDVFPLFRHRYYSLGKKEWDSYRLLVMHHIKQVK